MAGPLDEQRPLLRNRLLESLSDLSIRCSLLAVGVTVVAGVLGLVFGVYGGQAGEHSEASRPLLAAVMASFVLTPMLALTGAITAVVVASETLSYPSRSRRVRFGYAAFVLIAGALALVAAGFHVLVIVPAITS